MTPTAAPLPGVPRRSALPRAPRPTRVALCLGLLLVSFLPRSTPAETRRPNVVFVLADDLGYADLGVQGSRFHQTPRIDALAAAGLRFTQGYSCGPNCQPTRAALMSGQYGPRTGVYTVGSIERFPWRTRPLQPVENLEQLPLDRTTLAQSLRAAGYATGLFGKWHLGQDADHHPAHRGFDEALVSAGRHVGFVTDPRTEIPPDSYLADFLTDRALEFITRHRDHPFFLYLPHFGVHAPLQAKSNLVAQFHGRQGWSGQSNAVYAAMIASVDESVGRIIDHLAALGLSQQTLVIFSSDNGGVGGYLREGIAQPGPTDNAPLRGGKGMLYEGGIRVPWIFHWPGTIPSGRTCDLPIASVDLFPTLLELAGASPPDQPLDGISLAGTLRSGGTETPAREALFWHFPGYLGSPRNTWRTTPAGAMRAGDWKLLEFFEDGRLELYNLRADPGERHNLAASDPRRANELALHLARWRTSLHAPMPTRRIPTSVAGRGDVEASDRRE